MDMLGTAAVDLCRTITRVLERWNKNAAVERAMEQERNPEMVMTEAIVANTTQPRSMAQVGEEEEATTADTTSAAPPMRVTVDIAGRMKDAWVAAMMRRSLQSQRSNSKDEGV